MFTIDELQAIGGLAEEMSERIADKIVTTEGSIHHGHYADAKAVRNQLEHYRERFKMCGNIQEKVKKRQAELEAKPPVAVAPAE